MFSNLFILFAVLGWVLNKLSLSSFLKGSAIYIEAVALLAVVTTFGSLEIFFKALINPSLFLVICTAELSAKYSLFLDKAS